MSSCTDRRRVTAIAVAVALVPYALLVARFAFVCDDAYISFRYARHLALGHGLVYNLGESPPVEGYSNFLWTLWLAPFAKTGVDLGLAANATSIVCGVLLLALVTRFVVRRFALRLATAIVSALFFATLPPIALWSTSGLESLPFALATFVVFERLHLDPDRPRGVAAGIAALLAALLRADGAAWALVVLAASALGRTSPATSPPTSPTAARAQRRAIALALAILVAGVAAHVAWRLGYHGDWISNTARVKGGLSGMRIERGARYLAGFFLAVPAVTLALAAALALRGRPDRTLAARAACVILAAAGYTVFVGGDFMPMGRFLLVALPFVAILFAGSLSALSSRRSLASVLALAAILSSLLASVGLDVVPRALRERFHFRWNDPRFQGEVEQWSAMRARVAEWSAVGRALARCAEPGESIVLAGIGAIGYYSELEVFDRYGLVSPEVARRSTPLARASPGHDKGVGVEFFLDRDPDYLGAWIARRGSPPAEGLPSGWEQSPLARVTVIEPHPLDLADGFPPDSELRVLRYRRAH